MGKTIRYTNGKVTVAVNTIKSGNNIKSTATVTVKR